MGTVKTATGDWREREFVTLREAAAIARRSYSWARDCTISGRLVAHRGTEGRGLLVSTASLARLILDESQPVAKRPRYPHYIKLVVNNDRWILRGRRPKQPALKVVREDDEGRALHERAA